MFLSNLFISALVQFVTSWLVTEREYHAEYLDSFSVFLVLCFYERIGCSNCLNRIHSETLKSSSFLDKIWRQDVKHVPMRY